VECEGSGVAMESHPFPCLVSPGPEAVRGGWAAGAGAGGPCSASSSWGWARLAGAVLLTISANVGWASAHMPAAWTSWLRSYQEIDEVFLLNLEGLLPSENSVHSSFGDISH
jgi:hypothetical protein